MCACVCVCVISLGRPPPAIRNTAFFSVECCSVLGRCGATAVRQRATLFLLIKNGNMIFLLREEYQPPPSRCVHTLFCAFHWQERKREKKLIISEKVAIAGTRTHDLPARRWRGYELDHRGDRLCVASILCIVLMNTSSARALLFVNY